MRKNLLFFILACLTAISSYAQAPTISSFSPDSGAVGTLVIITGTNLSSPTAFTIGGVSAIIVSDSGTKIVAMVMPGAATGGISITTAGGSTTDSSSFTVTTTGYPHYQQGGKIVGTGAIGNAEQGYSIAISADGNTVVAGGPHDNNDSGAVWIYVRSGNSWVQQGSKLVGTGATGPASQGTSVAISADGNTVIEGGPSDNAYVTSIGAVWIFTRQGSSWFQQGPKLVGTGGTCGSPPTPVGQGCAVALSADGNTAIVGGRDDSSYVGAV